MGKRYAFLAGMISLLVTTISWQLMDDDIIPAENFMQKLLVGVAVVITTFAVTRLLIGKREEGIHL